jgi:hypothetical protein
MRIDQGSVATGKSPLDVLHEQIRKSKTPVTAIWGFKQARIENERILIGFNVRIP